MATVCRRLMRQVRHWLAFGVTALFSAILSVRGLWSLRRSQAR
jgi:hypothetical protein